MGGPLGGIIFGRRGPYGGGYPGGGGGYPGGGGPVMTGPHTHSAGTAEIARASGGDSTNVDDTSAFEDTLARIRQRYALHFYLPEGVQPGQERDVEVQLASAARRKYPDAEVRFRRVYLAPGGSAASGPVEVSRRSTVPDNDQPQENPRLKRRPAVNEPSGGPRPDVSSQDAPATDDQPRQGGWRRLKPGEQP
jgi:hypothetical protein